MIDWQQIDQILTQRGDPIEVEIYREFITATRDALALLERMLTEGASAKEILWELHRLKGSCGTFGLSGTASKLDEWEHRAKSSGVLPTPEDTRVLMAYFLDSLALMCNKRPELMAKVMAPPYPLEYAK